MTFKGIKLKSESFFSIFYGVLELWRKNPRGDPDRVRKVESCVLMEQVLGFCGTFDIQSNHFGPMRPKHLKSFKE